MSMKHSTSSPARDCGALAINKQTYISLTEASKLIGTSVESLLQLITTPALQYTTPVDVVVRMDSQEYFISERSIKYLKSKLFQLRRSKKSKAVI